MIRHESKLKRTMFSLDDQCYLTSRLSGVAIPSQTFQNTSLGMSLNANILLSHFEQAVCVFLPLPLHVPLGAWSATAPRDSEPRKMSFCTVHTQKRVLFSKGLSGMWWHWGWIKTTMLGMRDPGRLCWVISTEATVCWRETLALNVHPWCQAQTQLGARCDRNTALQHLIFLMFS